ncbi:hypothetical protein [Methylobacterium iners]|uniref:Hedgehog/Intein (Hint) domain-containing protein n=1 Tax=Methylobacterium iners TaxID=418707 RepID=A0ABQ4S2W2_9HYPH|nr:hypothetical protein [Methylobacterium iners]GJD97476.1 hypothetical protein OCOJLMKI_4707 [Methylobacterium iners]
MTSVLALVLARTLAASSLSEACVLETVAHGTVVTRGGFTRRELVRDRLNGEVPMLDAESLVVIEEAAAPGVEIGDLVHVDGKLWHVRSPLATAGSVTLQLVAAQRADVSFEGDNLSVYVAGDADSGGPLVALAAAGVLRRSDVVDVDGTAYTVGTPRDWPAGGLRRYCLTPE